MYKLILALVLLVSSGFLWIGANSKEERVVIGNGVERIGNNTFNYYIVYSDGTKEIKVISVEKGMVNTAMRYYFMLPNYAYLNNEAKKEMKILRTKLKI